jgi:two-component system, NtrC family, response regulator HydG
MNTNSKILIVDDNTNFCESVSEVLQLEGYETAGVHDGFNAIKAVQQDSFDLVIMDIKIPKMDGVDTFRKLKDISSKIPVIMMTAYAVEDRIRLALREGAFGIFKKPIEFKRLLCSIKKALFDGALIMIADDDEKLCSNLLDTLVKKGYRGEVANDGETAVKMARENKFEIILLDMKLPEMNGLETYLSIRDIRPDVEVIITGYKEEMGDLIEQALERNVYAYLQKPLNMDLLLEVIHKTLENKK